MVADNDRFFTLPTGAPSGVSAGHTIHHYVPCNFRGLTNLLLESKGVLIRRKCDRVEL